MRVSVLFKSEGETIDVKDLSRLVRLVKAKRHWVNQDKIGLKMGLKSEGNGGEA